MFTASGLRVRFLKVRVMGNIRIPVIYSGLVNNTNTFFVKRRKKEDSES